jgi:FKBP-type peptidyl-prolyl cis-trans isomerase 2
MKKGLNVFAKSPRRNDRCKVAFVIKTKDGEVIENGQPHSLLLLLLLLLLLTSSLLVVKMVLQPREIPQQSWGNLFTMMSEGDQWRVYVPPELAYGAEGRPEQKIAPHSPIIVEMELFLVMAEGKPRDEATKAFLRAQTLQPSEEL